VKKVIAAMTVGKDVSMVRVFVSRIGGGRPVTLAQIAVHRRSQLHANQESRTQEVGLSLYYELRQDAS
jgi:hypothetical protein